MSGHPPRPARFAKIEALFRKLAIAAAVVAALPAGPAAAADAPSCLGADAAPGSTQAGQRAAARAVVCLVNGERAARGLRRLHADGHLRRAAEAYVRAAHGRRPSQAADAQRRIAAAGYAHGDPHRFAFGEAVGHGDRRLTPAARVRAWLRNATTRKLLLGRTFRDAGVAVGPAGSGTVYVLDLAVPVG